MLELVFTLTFLFLSIWSTTQMFKHVKETGESWPLLLIALNSVVIAGLVILSIDNLNLL